MGNYRPISLLPVPGKILEKIVHGCISHHLESNNLLSEFQGGFRKNHSTTSSIIALTENIFKGIDKKEVTMAIFVDLAKAFNTINHKQIVVKLVKAGIMGNLLSWCKSYLGDRTQKTVANNTASGLELIPCWVPQGLVLGLLYINDLTCSLRNASVALYADDTVLYVTNKDGATGRRDLQVDLDNLSRWCGANKLSHNAKKTKQVNFGTRHQLKKLKEKNLFIDNSLIQCVPSFKYLGFTLNPALSFRLQLEQMSNIVGHKMYMLCKIKRYLNDNIMLCVYRSMVLPYFDHADVVIAGASPNLLNNLQKL